MTDETGDILRNRVRKRLDALGISARRASLSAGLSPDALRLILSTRSDSPRVGSVVKLAKALHTTVGYLVGERDSPVVPFRADDGPQPPSTGLSPLSGAR